MLEEAARQKAMRRRSVLAAVPCVFDGLAVVGNGGA